MVKKCKICAQEKDLAIWFYKVKSCKDGYSARCKTCMTSYVLRPKKEPKIKKEKTEDDRLLYNEKKRKRYLEFYKFNDKRSGVDKSKYMQAWREKNMEKVNAGTAAKKVPCPKGMHRHHWSYNKEHREDVIIMTPEDHKKIHRYIRYDKESMMYRDRFGDKKILDTRLKHEKHFESIKNMS